MTRPLHASSAVNAFARRLGILALAGGACLLSGCLGDAGLAEQTQAQAEIHQTGDRYRTLISGVGVDSDPLTVAGKLDQLSQSLQSIKGASSKQKKVATTAQSKARLTAAALALNGPDMAAVRTHAAAVESLTMKTLQAMGWTHVCWREAYVMAQLLVRAEMHARDQEREAC